MKNKSRATRSLVLTSVLASLMASSAFAAGPCATYRKECFSKGKRRGAGLWKCVEEEAKAANDQICLSKISEHKEKK